MGKASTVNIQHECRSTIKQPVLAVAKELLLDLPSAAEFLAPPTTWTPLQEVATRKLFVPALLLCRLACRRLPASLGPAPLTAVGVGGSPRLGFAL